MLYILFAVHNHLLIILAYAAYGLGIILAQVIRKLFQHFFHYVSNLKLQFLFFVLGAWLTIFPGTSPRNTIDYFFDSVK